MRISFFNCFFTSPVSRNQTGESGTVDLPEYMFERLQTYRVFGTRITGGLNKLSTEALHRQGAVVDNGSTGNFSGREQEEGAD